MADVLANVSLGKIRQYAENVENASPANSAFVLVILEVAEADDTLRDHDTLAAALAAANTEWTSPEYDRITLQNVTVTVDDTANDVDIDCDDFTLTAPTGNATVKAGVCYDPDTTTGDDSTVVPVAWYDFVLSPDGNDVNVQIPVNGFAGVS